MNKPSFSMLAAGALLFLALIACNLPQLAQPTVDAGVINTYAAQTVMAQLTQAASPGTTPEPGQPTSGGPFPTSTAAGGPTLAPSSTPAPSATPQPSVTPIPRTPDEPTAAPTTVACNVARFVKDVTIPDGTVLSPGAPFTKTWRIQNGGSCTWTREYALVFSSGDDMLADDTRLPETVEPGETVDVSVQMVAPDEPGSYRGNWKMEDDTGKVFGFGSASDRSVWVDIEVEKADEGETGGEHGIVYNFATSYCSADWESDAGGLPCPGDTEDQDGFVVRLTDPDLENRPENEVALWTNPEMTADGYISGEYPAFKVQNGDHFLADVGCLADNPRCDVSFLVSYRIGSGRMQGLGEWREVYDGKITRIDIDLSSLAGQSVKFILTVETNGSYRDDAAFWLVPQIRRP